MLNIFNTHINKNAFDNVKSVLDSTFLSEGKLVAEFEEKLASEMGLLNPVALNSGTSALHLALICAGIKPGDEVITTPQTFVATGLAILYMGAVPVFSDIQYETGNICPKSMEEKITEKTKAVLAVHWGGYPCDMDEIRIIAKKYNLIVIEDAAHAPGAEYKNKFIGSVSDFTCFSFQAIKHITTGDGGALCCKSYEKAIEAKAKRWFGINRAESKPSILGERAYDIPEIGYKYHLNDYSAALGIANLSDFKERLGKRRKYAEMYRKNLNNISGLKLFGETNDRKSAYWLFGLHVEKREDFIRALKGREVTASVIHQRIDRNSVFGGITQGLVNQERFDETQIHIPVHDGLDEQDVEYIIESIKKGW